LPLGSVSVASSVTRATARQDYDPWGAVRVTALQAGLLPIGEVARRGYTGRLLDTSGLMYYCAQYRTAAAIKRFATLRFAQPGSGAVAGRSLAANWR
jgi:hypothetical protein